MHLHILPTGSPSIEKGELFCIISGNNFKSAYLALYNDFDTLIEGVILLYIEMIQGMLISH